MTQVIGFHYTLKNDAGEVLESSAGGHPMLYLADSGQVLLTLDKQIQSLKVGETKSVTLDAKDAYGEICLLYTSPSPRDRQKSRMPSSA